MVSNIYFGPRWGGRHRLSWAPLGGGSKEQGREKQRREFFLWLVGWWSTATNRPTEQPSNRSLVACLASTLPLGPPSNPVTPALSHRLFLTKKKKQRIERIRTCDLLIKVSRSTAYPMTVKTKSTKKSYETLRHRRKKKQNPCQKWLTNQRFPLKTAKNWPPKTKNWPPKIPALELSSFAPKKVAHSYQEKWLIFQTISNHFKPNPNLLHQLSPPLLHFSLV